MDLLTNTIDIAYWISIKFSPMLRHIAFSLLFVGFSAIGFGDAGHVLWKFETGG